MNRSWYWKVSFVGFLAVVAVLYITPTLVRDRQVVEKELLDPNTNEPLKDAQGNVIKKIVVNETRNLPAWYPETFRRYITLGLDLQGGVLLQYGVDIYEAMRNKSDLYRDDVSKRLEGYLKDKGIEAKVIVAREGIDILRVTTEPAGQLGEVGSDFLETNYQVPDPNNQSVSPVFKITEQNENTLVLQLSSEFQEYLERYAIDQGVQTISQRIDKLAVKEPEIRKASTDAIVIQLPGLSEADFGQTQQIIEQTAQLQFKKVDDENTQYLNLLQQRVIKSSPIRAYSEGTSIYIRAEKKEQLLAFLHDATDFGEEQRRGDDTIYYKALDDFRQLIPSAKEIRFGDFRHETLKISFEAPTDPQVIRDAVNQYLTQKKTEVTAPNINASDFVIQTEAGIPAEEAQQVFILSKALRLPPDREILIGKEVDAGPQGPEQYWRTYWLNRKTELTGDFLTDAKVNFDENRRPVVSFAMNTEGAEKLAKLSKENIQKRFAIILDNEVKSAPVFQSEIPNGQGQITLGSAKSPKELLDEAQSLSIVLQAGALPAPLSRQFVTQVGPQLGKSAVDQGFLSAIVGVILIFLFMGIYYRRAGLIADVALALNLLLLLATMAMLGATLTLPGIAGIVLTIGTAVDSNILIFERIREELRLGKTPRQAIDAGYKNATRTILDANTTNLISALVLGWYGSGPVKGFAVTLLIGLVTSVFTSTFVTRLVFQYIAQRSRLEKLSI